MQATRARLLGLRKMANLRSVGNKCIFLQGLMYRYERKTREKSKVISGECSLNWLAEERVCGLQISWHELSQASH